MTTAREGSAGFAPLAALLVAVVAVQLVLLAVTLPASRLGGDATFWNIDHPYHLYQIELGRALLSSGHLTGYDPFFAGGYPGGVSFNQSARLPVLLGALTGDRFDTRSLYAFYVLLCAVAGPASIVWLAGLLRLPVGRAATLAVTGLAFWWCTGLHWYHTAGLTSFVFCAYVSIPFSLWVWSLATAPHDRWLALALAGLAGGLGLWVHPLFIVLVALLTVSCALVSRFGARPLRAVVRGSLVLAIMSVVNAPWIVAVASAPNLASEQPYQRAVGVDVLLQSLLPSLGGLSSILNVFAVILFASAMLRPTRLATCRSTPFVVAAALMLAFAAWGGASNGLAMLQPNRFAAVGFLLLAFAAILAACDAWVDTVRHGNGWQRGLVAVATVLVVGVTGREWVREIVPGPHGHHGKSPPELTSTPPDVEHLIDAVRSRTTNDGRVLFETSLARVHGGGHVASMVSLLTGRELMGGAYPFSQTRQSFWDRTGFGKPLAELGADELRRGLDQYNVGWIVAHSSDLKQRLDSVPYIRSLATIDHVVLYEVERPLSYVARGVATVRSRGFDRIEVTDAAGPEVVLRYNWTARLHACPAARIEAVTIEPDFPPLIRVVDPPPRFTLSTGLPCPA